jgi:hypothetical protein
MNCTECKNILHVISNEGIDRLFTFIRLDNISSKELQTIASSIGIKSVPTIVINVENHPPGIYEGPSMCAKWLTSFTLNRRNNIAQEVDNQRKLIQKAQAIARAQGGLTEGFAEAEMEGISDNYSYNATELCQPKNFVMIGEEDKHFIMTPQISEGKVDTDSMRRQLAEIESARTSDTLQMQKIMEQNQIRAIFERKNGL